MGAGLILVVMSLGLMTGVDVSLYKFIGRVNTTGEVPQKYIPITVS